MARFVPVDRDTQFLFPPSVQEWLPKDHLARFVVDVVEQLDLSGLEESYAGRGSDAHHPAMLVALLLYGYATGTFSSRALERASYDSIAFRYVTANTHPDHDTINSFRKRFLKQIVRFARTGRGDQEPVHDLSVLLQERLERADARPLPRGSLSPRSAHRR